MHWSRSLGAKFDLPLKFWLIALIALINSVSFTIIIPVFYPYAQKFGLNDFQASRLTSGYAMPAAFRVAIAQFFATPLLGRSDVFRRKPLLVISLFGTVVANLLASFTPVASLLFVARVFDGLTRGNTSIVSYSTPFWFRVFSHWRRLLLRCGSSRSLIVAVNLSDAASICDR